MTVIGPHGEKRPDDEFESLHHALMIATGEREEEYATDEEIKEYVKRLEQSDQNRGRISLSMDELEPIILHEQNQPTEASRSPTTPS